MLKLISNVYLVNFFPHENGLAYVKDVTQLILRLTFVELDPPLAVLFNPELK